MKERKCARTDPFIGSAPHYVGQQLAFLSPQEYVPGKLSDHFKPTSLPGVSPSAAPFQMAVGVQALSSNSNSMNL